MQECFYSLAPHLTARARLTRENAAGGGGERGGGCYPLPSRLSQTSPVPDSRGTCQWLKKKKIKNGEGNPVATEAPEFVFPQQPLQQTLGLVFGMRPPVRRTRRSHRGPPHTGHEAPGPVPPPTGAAGPAGTRGAARRGRAEAGPGGGGSPKQARGEPGDVALARNTG